MRIAITGAGGRLGRALGALADEHELRLIDEPGRPVPPVAGATTLEADLRDAVLAASAVEGCAALVHLAAHPEGWPAGLADGDVVDRCARGTFELLRAAVSAGVRQVVLASTLDLLEAYPPGWAVNESWRPRPSPRLHELGPYVAEVSAREFARAGWPLRVVCLRLGRLVDGETVQRGPADPRWLHLEDAVGAVRRALAYAPAATGRGALARGWQVPQDAGWSVFHVSSGRRARFPLAAAAEPAFGFTPRYDFGGAPAAREDRPAHVNDRGRLVPVAGDSPADRQTNAAPRRVAIFGASGPLAGASLPFLAGQYTLRLTDVLSPEEGAARIGARWPAAFRPQRLAPPHEVRRVDVSDGTEVEAAAEGMDALLNCTVVRENAPGAFRVNTLGTYNVMRAAVKHGIRRVVHTGPQVLSLDHPAGYGADVAVPDEAPIRAGASVYFHSKLLGLEICRVFAENHGLEVLALLFSTFVNPAEPASLPARVAPAVVSWKDAGRAVERALALPVTPSPFEVLRILGDLPVGTFTNDKAKRVLGWSPEDSLAALWTAR